MVASYTRSENAGRAAKWLRQVSIASLISPVALILRSCKPAWAEDTLYPRFAAKRLTEALEDSPVVLIQGPRQCGKTTLAQMVCTSGNLDRRKYPSSLLSGRPEDYTYFSFDDEVVRAGAEVDPLGFVADVPDRVIFDEVQRVPALFAALKLEVDRTVATASEYFHPLPRRRSL